MSILIIQGLKNYKNSSERATIDGTCAGSLSVTEGTVAQLNIRRSGERLERYDVGSLFGFRLIPGMNPIF